VAAETAPLGGSGAAAQQTGGRPGTPALALNGSALVRGGVERSTARRADDGWLAGAWADPRTRVLVVEDGQVLARFGGQSAELVFVPPGQAPDGPRFLLGVDTDDVAYFGVGGVLPETPAQDGRAQAEQLPAEQREAGRRRAERRRPDLRRAGLRDAGPLLADRDAGLLTHAVALANWHQVAVFCPRCGSATEPVQAGHSRRCTVDESEHFPRTDPAVIMAVTDPDDRCLLARNAQWPPRRVSVLAGFVEPGESAEQAVAREVHEETGIVVDTVTYAGSQPWPMPHNLMLGFRARATGTEIKVDADEIAEARWYSRDELRDCLRNGELLMPPSVSISRWLIETWYGRDLPTPG
jgi:NAD+ diphosphatase